MKSIITIGAIMLLLTIACESSKRDSVTAADEKNKEAFGKTRKEDDAEFIVDAVASCYSEIALAEFGLLHSADSALQRKLRVIEADHSRLLSELKVYAKKQMIAIPVEDSMDEKAEVRLVTYSNPEDFDARLCAILRDYDQEEIRKYETCMSRTGDAELKNWISVALPVLNDHLKMIKDHQDIMNTSK